jgi:hypothetical protein
MWLNICEFPHKLGSPSSYMTLQPILSEFPYVRYVEISVSFYQSRVQINFQSQADEKNRGGSRQKTYISGDIKDSARFCQIYHIDTYQWISSPNVL